MWRFINVLIEFNVISVLSKQTISTAPYILPSESRFTAPVFNNRITTTPTFRTFHVLVSCSYNQLIFNDRQSERRPAAWPINEDAVAAAARARKSDVGRLSITPSATSRARPQSDFSRGITRLPTHPPDVSHTHTPL